MPIDRRPFEFQDLAHWMTQMDQTIRHVRRALSAMGQTPQMMLTYMDNTHPLSEWLSDAEWDIQSWQASSWLPSTTIPNIGFPMALSRDNADTDFKAIAAGQWDTGNQRHYQ